MSASSSFELFHLPKILNASDIAIDPKDSNVNRSRKNTSIYGSGLPVSVLIKSNNREYLGEGGYYSAKIFCRRTFQGNSEQWKILKDGGKWKGE